MARKTLPPGEILRSDFMKPLGLTVKRLARELHVPRRHVSEVLEARRPLSADLALRLGRYFGVKPESWLSLQAAYDLEMAERQSGRVIEDLVMPLEAA